MDFPRRLLRCHLGPTEIWGDRRQPGLKAAAESWHRPRGAKSARCRCLFPSPAPATSIPARHHLQVGGEYAEVGGHACQAQVGAVHSHQHPVGLTVTGGRAAPLAFARAFGRRRVQPQQTEQKQRASCSRRRRGGVHGARARGRRRGRRGFAEQPRALLSSPGVVTGGCRPRSAAGSLSCWPRRWEPPLLSWGRAPARREP